MTLMERLSLLATAALIVMWMVEERNARNAADALCGCPLRSAHCNSDAE